MPDSAIADREMILASARNFPQVTNRAQLLVTQIRASGPRSGGPVPAGS